MQEAAMGYSGLESIVDSDTASDARAGLISIMVAFLHNHVLPDKGNEYNTDGLINVALILEEMVLPIAESYAYSEELMGFVDEAIGQLEQKIVVTNKWESGENRSYHLECYERMRDNLKLLRQKIDWDNLNDN
jgi:hypothetical protein